YVFKSKDVNGVSTIKRLQIVINESVTKNTPAPNPMVNTATTTLIISTVKPINFENLGMMLKPNVQPV
ncbi:hypothetical protein P5P81_00700, partial [Tritonibacter mobilis]|nr:hypothetical protein [Tritonibacter mobilis]